MENRDQAEGELEQARGTLKEKVGDAIDDKEMEYGGKVDRLKGSVREGIGDLREEVDEEREERD